MAVPKIKEIRGADKMVTEFHVRLLNLSENTIRGVHTTKRPHLGPPYTTLEEFVAYQAAKHPHLKVVKAFTREIRVIRTVLFEIK